MTLRQLGNSPLDRCESYNGCYIDDNKGVSGQKRNTESVTHPRNFASEFVRRNPAFVSRFLTGITKTATCWLWTRGLDAYGYGQMSTASGRAPLKVHRASWLVHHGSIPPGAHVLHTCDVRHCVNPDHLFLGDQAANMKDAAQKYRLPGNRKLSDAQIASIRARYVPRHNGKTLAAEFGISLVSVCRIAAGTQRRATPQRMSA